MNMESLRAENEALKKQINEQEKSLQLAGNLGNQLLETNNELNQQLVTITQEYSAKIEDLEQAKYMLQMKLDQKVHMEGSLNDEINSLKVALKNQKRLHQDFIDGEHADQISELKTKIRELQNDIEKLHADEQQQVEKYNKLEDVNVNLKEQLERQMERMNDTCSDELASLNAEVNHLIEVKNDLEAELKEIKMINNDKEMMFTKMKMDVENKNAETEQVECKATSYYNALEKCREEVKELKMELEQALMESQDNKKKGNSLFAEVEDRRVIAEKELVSLKVKYNAMEKQLEATRSQLHRLKLQLASRIQMSGGRADEKYMESLQQQLATANSHQKTLLEKLKIFQEKEAVAEACAADINALDGDLEHFSEYMKATVKIKDDEISRLKDEQHTNKLCLLAKSEDLRKIECKYHQAEKQVETLRGQVLKLELQVEELRIKYEPEKVKHRLVKQKFRSEAIPTGDQKTEDSSDCGVKENIQSTQEEATKPKRQRMDIKQIQAIMKNVPKTKKATAVGSVTKTQTSKAKKVGISETNTVMD